MIGHLKGSRTIAIFIRKGLSLSCDAKLGHCSTTYRCEGESLRWISLFIVLRSSWCLNRVRPFREGWLHHPRISLVYCVTGHLMATAKQAKETMLSFLQCPICEKRWVPRCAVREVRSGLRKKTDAPACTVFFSWEASVLHTHCLLVVIYVQQMGFFNLVVM